MQNSEFVVKFEIPGQPVPKGRPKFARRGAHTIAYTPAKTASYENLVRMAAAGAMAGAAPTDRAIELEVRLMLQIPASWSKRRRAQAAAGVIRATKKPDADNVLKGIKDGCNGVLWRDDAQVVVLSVSKAYSETPGAQVLAREVRGEPA